MESLLDLGTKLGQLSALSLLAVGLVVVSISFAREWITPGAVSKRADARADRNLAGWEAATLQFERALDLIDKMQSRRRTGDEDR